MSAGASTRTTRLRLVSVTAALLAVLLGAVILVTGLPGGSGSARPGAAAPATTSPSVAAGGSPAPAVTASPTHQPIQRARRTGSVESERPSTVRLPSGRQVPVEAVSSEPDGRFAVPVDIDHAGWFRGGSALGDPFGSTLVAAHIDSVTQGLGPFEELLSVRRGQRVRLTGASLQQDFRIDSLRILPQGSLADDEWIYAPTGKRRLTLVTCAPPYDRSRGGYQNLAVVTAVPVTDTPTPKD